MSKKAKALKAKRKPASDGSPLDEQDMMEMLNEDRQEAPLTEEQKGEQAGAQSVNYVRETANKAFEKAGDFQNEVANQESMKRFIEQVARARKKDKEQKGK